MQDDGKSKGETTEINVSGTTATIPAETLTEMESAAPEATDKDDPEPSPYSWIIGPGKFGVDSDIQPIYDIPGYITDVGLMILDHKYLVDYEGNKKVTFANSSEESDNCYFCNICTVIKDGYMAFDSQTYDTFSPGGHGYDGRPNYIYDSETGDICFASYGEYIQVTENIPYAVVVRGTKRPAGPEDYMSTEYVYETDDLYGIVINSRLVVPFEYDVGVNYGAAGIAALRKDGKWAFFDSAGRVILENKYSASSRKQWIHGTNKEEYVPYLSSSGYIALNLDGKWGFADTEGNIVVDFIFDEARPAYMGKAWVKTADGWGIIRISDPDIVTPDEAKKIAYDRTFEIYDYLGIRSLEVVPNGKKFYESTGFGFDITITENDGSVTLLSTFINFDGTILFSSHMN